jgi:hypothetical protein
MSAEYRGNPCHETASAPTIRYSTLFEFKHSINSLKSLLKDIGMGSLSKFAEDIDPLLGAHPGAGKRIRGVCLFKARENPNGFLHSLISLTKSHHAPGVIPTRDLLLRR